MSPEGGGDDRALGSPVSPEGGGDDRALTHLDAAGRARMVEVGGKAITQREAVASAVVTCSPATLARLLEGTVPKGDAGAVARIAGIMAAKRTAELIPLCHPLPLSGVEVEIVPEPPTRLKILATARTCDRTGVEMEALTAASVAALTLYDMLKALERGIEIGPIRLESKTGGSGGPWARPSR